jgi:hypothetical protein
VKTCAQVLFLVASVGIISVGCGEGAAHQSTTTLSSEKADLDTELVTWTPVSPEANLLFTSLLFRAAVNAKEIKFSNLKKGDKIKSSLCTITATRPRLEDDPIANKGNGGVCEVSLENGEKGSIAVDLAVSPIRAWGNRFFPKAFAIENELASHMFVAFRELYAEKSDHPWLAYRDVSLPSPQFNYDFITYAIEMNPNFEDGSIQGPAVLQCSKDFLYKPGTKRPVAPDKQDCVFTYQFEYIAPK